MSILRKRHQQESLVTQQITNVLAEVGLILRINQYRIEIAEYSISDGRLTLRIDGNCPDCDLSPATFIPAIEAHVRQRVPEVREVALVSQ